MIYFLYKAPPGALFFFAYSCEKWDKPQEIMITGNVESK